MIYQVKSEIKQTVVKKVEEIQKDEELKGHFKKYKELKTDFKRLNKENNKSKLEIYDIYKLN